MTILVSHFAYISVGYIAPVLIIGMGYIIAKSIWFSSVIYIGQKYCKIHWVKDVLHMGQVPRTVLAVIGS